MHFPLYLAHCYLFFKTQLRQHLLEEVLLCSSTLMTQFGLPVVLLEHLVLASGIGQHVGSAYMALSPTLNFLLLLY